MNPMHLEIDESLVSRLLLGALSDHEQRRLTAQLARSDDGFRTALRPILERFEMFDADLALEYRAALDQKPLEADRLRREILDRAERRAGDLEPLISELTVHDVLSLGEVTRKLFSWSMAEYLLRRSQKSSGIHQGRISLYLARLVIDVVEILTAVGSAPRMDLVITDVRHRIQDVSAAHEA